MLIVIVTSMSYTTNAIVFKEDERRNTSIWQLRPQQPHKKTYCLPTVMYGCEAWAGCATAFEIKSLSVA